MTFVCGWGSNSFGQLGVENDPEKDSDVLVPERINFFDGHSGSTIGVACGWSHTLFWMSNGLVYSAGLNDYGQLGYSNDNLNQPGLIKALEAQIITHASCGEHHTVVINDKGLVFSFGNNEKGQLGIGLAELSKSIPRHIKGIPQHIQMVKVSCGKSHTIAISSVGDVFCWGSNEYGQCGIGGKSEKPILPHRLPSFHGCPVYMVAAGGYHSLVLTISGTLFSWGKNGCGQLGLGDNLDKPLPMKIKMLCGKSSTYISCGEEHSAVLTNAGGVYTFGAGSSGQLGHNSFNDEYYPRMVSELMGTTVTQIACGRKHTLAYMCRTGRLFAFGLGASGQLGINSLEKRSTPVMTQSVWKADERVHSHEFIDYMNNNSISYFEEEYTETILNTMLGNTCNSTSHCSPFFMHEIFAGGLHSIATLADAQSMVLPSLHCVIKKGSLLVLSTILVEKMLMDHTALHKSMEILSKVFSSPSCLNGSFLKRMEHSKISLSNHGIHLMAVRHSFALLDSTEQFHKVILHCVKEYLIPSLVSNLSPEPEALRLFLMLPELPFFNDMTEMWMVIIPFANAYLRLSSSAQKIIDHWWATIPSTFFERIINACKSCVRSLLDQKLPETPNAMIFSLHEALKSCIMILEKLDKINNEVDSIVPYSTFYIGGLMEKIKVEADYMNWIQQPDAFSFCKYPFAFDVKVKARLLEIDADRQMQDAVKDAHLSNIASLVTGYLEVPIHPLLVLNIRREFIVRDTLSEILMRPPSELKKPLKVKFSNEDAEDAGGVRKEFFLLLMREILDPKYGMFDFYEDTRVIWFKSQSFEDVDMYMLIGIICGLAIYNSTIIDLPFPLCLYKKLLNKKVNLDDLRGLQPDVARGLQELLDYQGDDLTEVFDLNFQISEQSFGETKTIDLIPGGGNITVTEENKEDYVNAYINYKLNSSVDKEFRAFSLGFHRVCGGSVLNLFHPQELMEFVVGSQDYDFADLELAATYQGAYYRDHPVIQRFWEVFRGFTIDLKKKFLAFLTGSDKVSIFGMKNMKFIIQPVGSSEEHLPVAHTCFNLLDLPRYQSVETLRKKLCQAIENSQGFALV